LNGAVEAYERALAIDNEYADAHYNLSVALLRLKRTEEAEKHLREALRIAPEDPGANVALGDACTDRRDFEGALSAYSAAMKTLVNDAMIGVKVCSSLRRLQRIPEAFQACQEAVRLGPDVSSTHEALALVYVVQGDMAAAIPVFQRTLELDPKNHSALANLATCLKSEGRAAESIEPYRKAIALRPEEPVMHVQLADSLMTLERADEAMAEFETALRLAPQDLDARLYYARALRLVGKNAEAVTQYQHVLTLRPDHPEAVRAIQQISGGP
jgi:tetratricopeptide (TPR) repeat protein